MRDWLKNARALAAVAATAVPFASDLRAAPATDKPFTVANYPVEAQAKDAVAAKEKAHADGQQAAFRSLLKRIVPVMAYNRIERLKGVNAGDYVDGVAVRSERNSSTEYIASLDFSFQPDAVRDLLRRESVPYIDAQAPQIVIVPVTRDAPASGEPAAPAAKGAQSASAYRAAGGTWNEVWKDLDLDNTLTPARVERLNAAVHPDTIDALLGGDGAAERILTGEYRTPTVVLAIAEVDKPAQRVNVTLAGSDAVGPFVWKRSYRLNDGDVGYAMELASVVSLGVLEGRWKAVKTEPWAMDSAAGSSSQVQLEVEFSSLAEWNDIRRQLLDTDGIDDLRVGAVSARSAEVSVRYPGGGQPLADALARQGLNMRNGGSVWFVRAGF